jgi:polyisoprenoid-binding protein YceI
MQRARGTVVVFTFKDGLLARAAHDLALRCDGCEVTLDGNAVTATIPLRALTVVGPVEAGVVRPEVYDDQQRREIEATMRDQILHLGRYPEARFEGRALPRADGFDVSGDLALAGRRAPISFAVRREGER